MFSQIPDISLTNLIIWGGFDVKLIPFMFNANYHNIFILDHSPITFALKLSEITTTQPLWQADPYLLKDTKFCEYLRIQLELFF